MRFINDVKVTQSFRANNILIFIFILRVYVVWKWKVICFFIIYIYIQISKYLCLDSINVVGNDGLEELNLISFIVHLNCKSTLFLTNIAQITLSNELIIHKVGYLFVIANPNFKDIFIFKDYKGFRLRFSLKHPSTISTITIEFLILM